MKSCRHFWLLSYSFSNCATTSEICSLSLHDALPILLRKVEQGRSKAHPDLRLPYFVGFAWGSTTDIGFHGIPLRSDGSQIDRKSTRLNSSHTVISYAVFCLKKKIT